MSSGTVLVLGAAGGVGQAVAASLSAAGYEVIATCRTPAQGKQLVKAGVCRMALSMDLEQPATMAAAFAKLKRQGIHGLVGLVNCAAITAPKPLELASLDEVRRSFEINVFGALGAIQLALPLLRLGQGRIVMVSSTSGSLGVPLLGAYSASKFALEGLADVLRRELAQWSIKVSLVIPGGIKTPMIERQLAEIDAALRQLKPGIEAEYEHQYRQHRKLIELADQTAVPPSQVAADVLRALSDAAPKPRYLCGVSSKGTRAIRRVMPDSLMDRVFGLLPASKK